MRLGLRAVLVGANIVHEQDIDLREPETLIAVLDRAHDAIIRIIVNDIERKLRQTAILGVPSAGMRLQQSPDLGGQYPGVTVFLPQRVTHAMFGGSDAIERRRIDVTNAGVPRGAHDRLAGWLIDVETASSQR